MKLATIGTGFIVERMLDHIRDIDGIQYEAVYSRDIKKAQDFAAEHGAFRAYDSLDELFADPDVDTVYIASPNTLHYPQAKQALLAGKNVILEKPFTTTAEQAKELFNIAEENGLMIFEAITNIHTPNFGLLREALPEAGKIREGIFNFSRYSSAYDLYRQKKITNTFDPEFDGGALTDINIYNLHLAYALFGNPQDLVYFPVKGYNGVDTSGVLILKYPDFVITCIVSKDCQAECSAQILGEDGTFVISDASTGVLKTIDFFPLKREEDEPVSYRVSIDQGSHMTYEFMDFLIALQEQDQKMYEQYRDETLAVMELLEKAKKDRDA